LKTLQLSCIAFAAAVSFVAVGPSEAQQPRAARAPDGMPDLSGIWRAADSRYGTDLTGGNSQVVLQPWAAALHKERRASQGKGRPSERCLPHGVPAIMLARNHPWQIVQTAGNVVILFHESLHFRQIFTDGRPFPADPAPSWLGYTIGRWDGDTLVAETIGQTEQTWLDESGHPHSEAMRVTERFRRRGADALDIDFTIDDQKAFGKPWTVSVRFERVDAAELGEDLCAIQPRGAKPAP
jgi:hypothetical protein